MVSSTSDGRVSSMEASAASQVAAAAAAQHGHRRRRHHHHHRVCHCVCHSPREAARLQRARLQRARGQEARREEGGGRRVYAAACSRRGSHACTRRRECSTLLAPACMHVHACVHAWEHYRLMGLHDMMHAHAYAHMGTRRSPRHSPQSQRKPDPSSGRSPRRGANGSDG